MKKEIREDIVNKINFDISARNEYFFEAPQMFIDVFDVKNKEDMPLVHTTYNLTLIALILPVFQLMGYFIGIPWLLMFVIYYGITYGVFLGRFVLAFHYSAHQNCFKNQIINDYYYDFLGIFFGYIPFMYRLHHLVTHHVNDNKYPYNLSLT